MIEEKILAKIDDKVITYDDVQNFINLLDPKTQAALNNDEGIKKILNELVTQELLLKEAREKELDKEKEFIDQRNKQEENLLKQYSIAKLFSSIKITDEDLLNYYESHKEYFVTGDTYEASHILVKTKEEAENAKNRLEKESFEDVAKDISTCPSGENGGYLGIFKSEQMVAEFSEALKKLNKNEISDPVKTNFGYHIIKLINYNEKSIISFEQAKEEIKRQFLALKQQEVYIDKANELKKKYNTQIFLND